MANQGGTHEQHVKAGKASHKGSEDTTKSASAPAKKAAAATDKADTKSTAKQGGDHAQQSKAGQQSHKNKH